MDSRGADFNVAIGAAAAALTGLLFVAVALRGDLFDGRNGCIPPAETLRCDSPLL